MLRPRRTTNQRRMASKPRLLVDFVDAKAARLAVERWHYSQRLPLGPLVRLGVWEGDRFAGVVLFGRGASNTLGKAYGLGQTEVCELVRVAMRAHATPVSKVVKFALRKLRESNPGLRLVVSFADPSHGHHGGIYQAGGWVYAGQSGATPMFFHDGRWKHNREVSGGAFGGERRLTAEHVKHLPKKVMPGKFRYLMPLDDQMRRQVAELAQPYPKRADVERIIEEASGGT